MPIKFPKNPNEGRRDPFSDESGKNPFSDGSAPAPDDANAYAPPTADAGPSYRPQFVATHSHRGGTILVCGLIGLMGSIVGLITLPIDNFGGLCLMVFPWLSLTLSFPAALMGHADLKAFQLGAMEPYGRGATRAGYVMGLLAMFITAACTAYYVVGIILYSIRL